ncbi:hypothetical protein C9439_01515 [archaeon SCG-AAA382B04]|nr:hypothetical protein C9439_01515 [archaeon SCG-AAA382B04]
MIKEKIRSQIEEKMEEYDLEYFSDKEDLVNEIYKRFCRDCQLKKECNICETVKDEINQKIKEKVGEKNIR